MNPHDGETLVKRLVGLPGDRIQMIHGVLHINRKPVMRERVADYVDNEPDFPTVRRYHYIETLPNGVKHDILGASTGIAQDSMPQDDTPEYVVPTGHYFGMGDNRDNSTDSRFLSQVGYIPAENLIGRAEFQTISTKDGAPLWQFWKWPRGPAVRPFLPADPLKRQPEPGGARRARTGARPPVRPARPAGPGHHPCRGRSWARRCDR